MQLSLFYVVAIGFLSLVLSKSSKAKYLNTDKTGKRYALKRLRLFPKKVSEPLLDHEYQM